MIKNLLYGRLFQKSDEIIPAPNNIKGGLGFY